MSKPEVVPRSYWNSAERGGAVIVSSKVNGITNHWPAHPGIIGKRTKRAIADLIYGWWKYHTGTRGWSDIGYNLGVDQSGRIWDLRGIWRIGAHCASPSNPTANHSRIGVLFILGVDEQPSAEMINAYRYLRHEIVFEAHGSDANHIEGHREVPGAQTSCPGSIILGLENQLSKPYSSSEANLPDTDDIVNDVWFDRTYDYVNEKDKTSARHQLARSHQYSYKVVRNNGRHIWKYRGYDMFAEGDDRPTTKDWQIARTHLFSFEGRNEGRDRGKALRRIEKGQQAILSAIEGIDNDAILNAIHTSSQEDADRISQLEQRLDEAVNQRADISEALEEIANSLIEVQETFERYERGEIESELLINTIGDILSEVQIETTEGEESD